MALHRLPNGAWINLTAVTGILPYESRPSYPLDRPPQVEILHQVNTILSFDTYANAQAYADELGALVNAALKGAEKLPNRTKNRTDEKGAGIAPGA